MQQIHQYIEREPSKLDVLLKEMAEQRRRKEEEASQANGHGGSSGSSSSGKEGAVKGGGVKRPSAKLAEHLDG